MLVSKLISKLKEYPDDTHVYLKGAACYEVMEPEPVETLEKGYEYIYNEKEERSVITEVIVLSY